MKDKIKDTDTHFIIDGSTRLVKNASETKSMLVQFDHHSERFTFRVPRHVDSHDLSLCNAVRVHYLNIDKSKRMENGGVDDISDTLEVCPEDEEYVICSWLITNGSTQLAGSLHFVIQFAVVENEVVKYSWNTAKYTNITISDGLKQDETFATEYNDILTEWENQLKANHIVNLEQTTASDEDNGVNVWTATFGDGSTQELTVRNGSKGETGLVGSIETREGKPLHFSVCPTEEDYEELSNAEKSNLFAIIEDDPTVQEFETLKDSAMTLYGGTFIPSGSDLNDYITEGNYYIPDNNTATGISNVPIGEGGQLKVLSGVGHRQVENAEYYYIIQMYVAINARMYIRHFVRASTNSWWSNWEQFAGDGSYTKLRGNGTSFEYEQDFSTTKHLNEYTEEGHYFVMNKDVVDGAPYSASHGYLDISRHSGKGFNKSECKPTIKQVFTAWDSGDTYTRIFNGSEWSDWKSHATTAELLKNGELYFGREVLWSGEAELKPSVPSIAISWDSNEPPFLVFECKVVTNAGGGGAETIVRTNPVAVFQSLHTKSLDIPIYTYTDTMYLQIFIIGEIDGANGKSVEVATSGNLSTVEKVILTKVYKEW